ncbi:MAG: PASTA domain-containing protein [Clostridia bacterium]|nr:PASTA domain-containing protein [Clostridia bacterium]
MDDRRADSRMIKRIKFVAIVLGVVCFAAVIVKLFYMQVINYDFYQSKAENLQTRDITLYPTRGTIYDTNMKPLAISANTEMLILMGNKLESDEQRAMIAAALSEILELEYETVRKKTRDTSSYIVISRGIEKDKADAVREFISKNKLSSCMYMLEDSTRYYPYSNFLAHVLGFVGSDEQGLAGIEYMYDDVLSGTVGRMVTATNVSGDELPFEYETYFEAVDGNSLVLTIDEVLQHYLEKNLEIAYNDNNVQESAIGIVMDVNTGAVLAMATYPDYDPNNAFTIVDTELAHQIDMIEDANEKAAAKSNALYKQWSNQAVSLAYHPGSTFKIITASIALEENVVDLNTTFVCSGSYTVGVERIHCWRSYNPHNTQNLALAIQNSCNPAFIQMGLMIGKETFTKYFEAFGLRSKTGVDLPGETTGLYNLKQEIDLAVYSFGQNFSVSPLQLITAVSAVANGGTLLKPYIVKEILTPDGSVVQSNSRTEVRQVISEETSAIMRELVESVVTVGTGKNAYTAGYRVAGKTGTTEKIAEQLQEGKELRIASFVAFAPADDPEIAVLIILDEPTGDTVTAGITVAPVIRRFMEEAMPYLGVEPQYTEEELENQDITIPDLRGMTLSDANDRLKWLGINGATNGSGEKVVDQLPAPGSVVSNTATVMLYMESSAPQKQITMPDLSGMSLEKARSTLQSIGLYVRVTGAKNGTGNIAVIKQDVPGGETVNYGQVITIELSDLDQRAD